MNHSDPLLACARRIERLVHKLTEKPNRCLHCPHEVSLTPPMPVPKEVESQKEVDPQEKVNPQEETYNQVSAAKFLERSERQLYRYRIMGKLPFSHDEAKCIRYSKCDLEWFFEKLHGFPKGGFGK